MSRRLRSACNASGDSVSIGRNRGGPSFKIASNTNATNGEKTRATRNHSAPYRLRRMCANIPAATQKNIQPATYSTFDSFDGDAAVQWRGSMNTMGQPVGWPVVLTWLCCV
jgi:hypothetical protein